MLDKILAPDRFIEGAVDDWVQSDIESGRVTGIRAIRDRVLTAAALATVGIDITVFRGGHDI